MAARTAKLQQPTKLAQLTACLFNIIGHASQSKWPAPVVSVCSFVHLFIGIQLAVMVRLVCVLVCLCLSPLAPTLCRRRRRRSNPTLDSIQFNLSRVELRVKSRPNRNSIQFHLYGSKPS